MSKLLIFSFINIFRLTPVGSVNVKNFQLRQGRHFNHRERRVATEQHRGFLLVFFGVVLLRSVESLCKLPLSL